MQIEYKYDKIAFGNRFREERERLGYRHQKDLADVMGVSRKYISKLETGASPSIPFLIKLGDLTGCDLNYILCGRRVVVVAPQTRATDIICEPPGQYGSPDLKGSKKSQAVYDDVVEALVRSLNTNMI